MTQTIRTPDTDTDTDPAQDGLDGGATVAVADVLDRVWRLLISMKTGLALLFALGLLSLIGTLVKQAPEGAREDAAAYAAWVDSVRPTYGGWTVVLDRLGWFHVSGSWMLKGIAILLSLSIVACSVHRTPHLWRRATRRPSSMSDAFFVNAQLRYGVPLPVGVDQARLLCRDALRSRRFRVVEQAAGDEDGVHDLYADRFRFGPFGTIVAHVSFVIILLGMLVSSVTGFDDDEFVAAIGSKVPVGHGTGLVLQARSFSDTYYPDGSPKDYVSDVALYRGDKQVAAQQVRVNEPLRYGGVSFFQSTFGFAVALRVTDPAGGAPVFDGGVPLKWQSEDGRHSIGQFLVPGRDLTVDVIETASGAVDPQLQAGQIQVNVFSGGSTPVASQVLTQGTPATVAGLSFLFVRDTRYTGLIVSRDPGAALVWVGSTFLVLGLCVVLLMPHRRIWVRVRGAGPGSEVSLASPVRRDMNFERRFHQLAADIRSRAEKSPPGPSTQDADPADPSTQDADPADPSTQDADPADPSTSTTSPTRTER